jgi:predicted deacylase
MIIIAAMHGNEPTGLMALLDLKARLRSLAHQMQGEVIGLIGNFKALERGERFIDTDLNRMWRNGSERNHGQEDIEKEELHALIDKALAGDGARYVLDLHTTSADSPPFMSIGDTEANRNFASRFKMPAIAGIERFIHGALLEYISEMGHVGLAFEAGQHTAAKSVDIHEDFVMEALHHTGILEKGGFTCVGEGRQFDIVYRHGISPEDEFRMNPGYMNLTPIHKGQIIAKDRFGDVRAPKEGLLFMPLYQKLGNDGFFIVR